MIMFLVSLFDCFSFSNFGTFCFLAAIVQLICSSDAVIFYSISWLAFQDLSCYVLFFSFSHGVSSCFNEVVFRISFC